MADDIQTERWELQKKISENNSHIISTESSVKERLSLKDRLKQRIKSETDLVERLKAEEKAYASKYKSANDKSKELSDQKDSTEAELNKLNQGLIVAKSAKQSHAMKLESLSNQLQFYQELLITQADLPSGLKYVFENKIETNSIIGTVADIFSTNEKYEVAINTALGDFIHCLICQDRKSALQILSEIKGKQAGKISIIPLKDVLSRTIELAKVPKNDLIIGRASDLIKSKDQFQSIAELLLGNILIVKDLNKAISDPNLIGWTLIDLKGASLSNNLIFKKPGSAKGTIIGRPAKIESLQTEIEKLEKTIKVDDSEIIEIGYKESRLR